MTNKFAKIGALALGVTFALSLSVNTAGAQMTAAQLQAQINALMAQLASLQGSAAVTFTSDLTVGSTGPQVVALQQMLVAQGHLVMPAGVAYGYFGSLTRAAVMRWQAANGVSATGYFGPISRAKANASGGATGTVPGTTIGGGASSSTGGTINTPGVEGTLTARLAPNPGSGVTVEEGENKVAVLGIELEADLSDIRVERIKLKLDQTTTATNDRDFYRDIAERLYIMDGSTVLASVALNSDTVIEESTGNYYVTVTGLNHIVRKDTEDVLTVAIDAQDSWDSDFDDDTWTVTVPADGVRGVDGAGINQFSPDTAFSRTFSTDPDSADTATLTISLDSDTPEASQVIASEGADEDEVDGVELIKFDAKAEDDNVTITDVVVTITRGGSGTATATTAYLFDGSTQVASATVAGDSTATFDDLEISVGEDSTKTLTVKVDIIDANTVATTFDASSVTVTAENSQGDSATVSGSANGETMTVLSAGPELSLTSDSISKTSNDTNSTAKGTFNIRVTAVGGDVVASTTGAFDIDVFENGTATSTVEGVYNTPSGATVSGSNITIAEGTTVTFVVDALYTLALAGNTAKFYAFGVEDISMNNATFNFMDGDTDWRTDTVVLP